MSERFHLGGLHITEWVKVGLAVAAGVIGFNEFILKDRAREAAKLTNTREFLLKGTNREVLISVSNTIRTVENSTKPDKWQAYAEAAPYQEYLAAWAVCVASDLCDDETSLKFLCQKIEETEMLTKALYQKIDIDFAKEKRDSFYSGMITECQKSKHISK